MKEIIRENCFETNSSSNHSISVRNHSIDNPVSKDGYIHCGFGEFGWGYEKYNDFWTKLAYLLTMVAETENKKFVSEEEYYQTDGFQFINNFCKEKFKNCKGIIIEYPNIKATPYGWTDFNGYIDHQSYEDYNNVNEFLSEYDIDIETFLLNENVDLIIDNDNH